MIVIELNGKEYNLPEGWNEVSVRVFQEIAEIAGRYSDYKSDIEYIVDMLEGLTGAPKEELMKMTRRSFDALTSKITWVNGEVKPSKKTNWLIGGEEWIPVTDLDSLTMGDTVSLEIMIKESNETTILGNILPILIRRVKKIEKGGKIKKVPSEFAADEYKETREIFLDKMMVSDVIQLKTFFLDGERESSITSEDTSEKERV